MPNDQLKHQPAVFGQAPLVRRAVLAGTDFQGLLPPAGRALPTPAGASPGRHTTHLLFCTGPACFWRRAVGFDSASFPLRTGLEAVVYY